MEPSPSPYLREVTENSASGEIARIYREIRRLSAVPFVALIYRHLASIPEALESVWRAVAPLLESGELQECAWRIGTRAWPGPGAETSDHVRALGSGSLLSLGDVLDAYNRANPVNFAIVSLLKATPQAGGPTPSANPRVWTPPPMISALPPIAPIADLPPEVRECVDAFAKRSEPDMPAMVPTLYRHLAHWPSVLAFAQDEVLPRLAAGTFAPAIDRFRAAIQFEAAKLRGGSPIADAPLQRRLTPVLDRFSAVIPEMVVVGNFLSRSFAPSVLPERYS